MKLGFLVDSISSQSSGIGYYSLGLINNFIGSTMNDCYLIDYKNNTIDCDNYIKVNNPFLFLRTYLWHNYVPIKISNFDYIFNISGCPHLIPYKAKEFFFVHDISWHHFPQHHPLGRVLFHRYLFNRTIKNCYKVIAVSNFTKNDLIESFNIPENKILVLYPSVNDKHIKPEKPKLKLDFPYILFIGTIEPRKNLESLIRAFYLLKKKYSCEHKLLICGKTGWKYSNVFKLENDLNLKNEVIFKGYVSQEVKKYLLRNAELFVYPSFYEGYGIPVIEAFSNKCPVITSNLSSLPEISGNAALYINPYDIPQLAESMQKVLTDGNLRKKLVKRGVKRIEYLKRNSKINALADFIK